MYKTRVFSLLFDSIYTQSPMRYAEFRLSFYLQNSGIS